MLIKCHLSSQFLSLLRKTPSSLFLSTLFLFILLILPAWLNAQAIPSCVNPSTYIQISVPANTTVSITSSTISGTGLLIPWPGSSTVAQKVIFEGSGKVEFDYSYTFAPGSDIVFNDLNANAGVIEGGFIVSSGATLTLLSGTYGTGSGTRVRGCYSMFDGITVETGSSLSIAAGCNLEDAFSAVTLEDQSSLTANGVIFKKNYIGILSQSPTSGGSRINISLSLTGNEFYGHNLLEETCLNQDYPHHAIFAQDVVNVNIDASSTPSSPNLFANFKQTYSVFFPPIPIGATNSNLTVKNAHFTGNGQLPIGGLADKPNSCITSLNLYSVCLFSQCRA